MFNFSAHTTDRAVVVDEHFPATEALQIDKSPESSASTLASACLRS
jgi:hypothetical protein